MPHAIGFDFETFQIQPDFIAPPPVCLTLSFRDEYVATTHLADLPATTLVRWNEQHAVVEMLIGNDHPETFGIVLARLASDPEIVLVGANASYDSVVALYDDPLRLVKPLFDAYEAGRIHDVQIREKLFRLSTTGNLESMTMPNGHKVALNYGLADLEKRHLGIDRTDEKEDEDSWRLRYSELDGVPATEYPGDAVDYAMADATGALLVWERQNATTEDRLHGSMVTHELQAAADFCLFLMTAHGLMTDQEQVGRLTKALDGVLSPENHKPLYEAGLLVPATEEAAIMTKSGKPSYHRTGPKKGQVRMKQAQPEKARNKKIQEYVETLCKAAGLAAPLTDKGSVKIDADTIQQIKHLDPHGLLEIYATRQEHLKMRSTYEKVLTGNETVWPGYNVLVSTGRTSSKGFKRGRELYPSCNIQNIPRMERGNLNVRACFRARPGKLLCSIDFSALELCAFAQITYNLFGYSVHRDKINAGYDLHAFLGAQLAAALDPEFREVVTETGIESDVDAIYQAFMALKKCEDPELEGLFKHYRTFAKPTGLGYPGGLGADKFIEFARKTYGVIIEDREQAVALKNLWIKTYPEADAYLKGWVPTQTDERNREDEQGGFCYLSPLGMFRANSNYCATANGKALQTPSAEGAKLAIIDCLRRCVDPSRNDPLFGSMLWAYVHDEIIFEFDEDRAAELGPYASKLMCDAMSVVMPDVKLTAEPSYMRRWLKGAEGNDVVWDMDETGKIFSEPLDKIGN